MEQFFRHFPHPYAELGTPLILLLAIAGYYFGRKIIESRESEYREAYRKRQVLLTLIVVTSTVIIIVLWARLLQRTGTFLGLMGGGLAIALREPLMAIAGRIAILAGRIYSVGDRVQVEQLTGDVIDVGFFYTRMMEVGNWIKGDQVTGRIVQFSNSKIFGDTPVYNYTRDFAYIWDELMLPVTYSSNLTAATSIVLKAANEYTREFLSGAQDQLEAMRHYFLVPSVELDPQVYLTVNSNWVELHLRYVVAPKKRRAAMDFIWKKTLDAVQRRNDVEIASESSAVSVRFADHQTSLNELPAQAGEQRHLSE